MCCPVLSDRDRAVAAIRARIVPAARSDGPAERGLNPLPGLGVLAIQALRVDPEQDVYRVPGPLAT